MNDRQFSISVRLFSTAVTLAISMAAAASHAAGAHIHGQGSLDITIEPDQVYLVLSAPTSDLGAGKQTAERLITRGDLFEFSDTSCTLRNGQLEDPTAFTEVWGGDHTDEHEHDPEEEEGNGHSDTYLSWTYSCKQAPARIEIKLFTATQLNRILVQAASNSGVVSDIATTESTEIALPNP